MNEVNLPPYEVIAAERDKALPEEVGGKYFTAKNAITEELFLPFTTFVLGNKGPIFVLDKPPKVGFTTSGVGFLSSHYLSANPGTAVRRISNWDMENPLRKVLSVGVLSPGEDWKDVPFDASGLVIIDDAAEPWDAGGKILKFLENIRKIPKLKTVLVNVTRTAEGRKPFNEFLVAGGLVNESDIFYLTPYISRQKVGDFLEVFRIDSDIIQFAGEHLSFRTAGFLSILEPLLKWSHQTQTDLGLEHLRKYLMDTAVIEQLKYYSIGGSTDNMTKLLGALGITD